MSKICICFCSAHGEFTQSELEKIITNIMQDTDEEMDASEIKKNVELVMSQVYGKDQGSWKLKIDIINAIIDLTI